MDVQVVVKSDDLHCCGEKAEVKKVIDFEGKKDSIFIKCARCNKYLIEDIE